MSYFEAASFCSAGEYRAGKNTHLMPSELQVNELYMLMMAVEYQKHDRAVKWPSSVLEVQALRTGSHLIRFALLDEDLQHYSTGFAEFNAGFWVRSPNRPNLRDMLIKEGYFKGYEDNFDHALREISQGLAQSSTPGSLRL